jgi:formamidopyrimidine-DNA glycosylase
MPEGPEVENVVRSLAPHLTGRTIVGVSGWRGDPPWAAVVMGQTIRSLERFGKYILLHFDEGMLQVHLRMTGKLLYNGERTPYTRVEITLDEGLLLFDDIRRFGRMQWSTALPAQGPEPLAMTAGEFAMHLKGRRARVKPLLLNQKFLRSLGNIYVDEALFAAGIHPLAMAARLSDRRLERLHQAVVEILQEAIAAGGSSISDYVDADGARGNFQHRHQVYGRAGEPCPRCGHGIERMVVGQRGTHLCRRCQRR